jgi:hypothetical protein
MGGGEYTQSERHVIELFQKLGYDYLDAKTKMFDNNI